LVQPDKPYPILGQKLDGRGEVCYRDVLLIVLGGEFDCERYGVRLAQRAEADALEVQVVGVAYLKAL
jgi:hypothetical protein